MNVVIKLEKNEQLVHISKEQIDITYIDNKGVGTTGSLEHDDFLKILTGSSVDLSAAKMESHLMGANIVKFRHNKDGCAYYFLVPKGKYEFNYEGMRKKLNYPSMIFRFVLDEKRMLRSTNLYTIKSESLLKEKSWGIENFRIKESTLLYNYPIGNVGSENKLCWGSNYFEPISTYQNLFEVVGIFFSSPTNTDYASSVFRDPTNRLRLLKKFENEPFDEELLVTSGITFGEI